MKEEGNCSGPATAVGEHEQEQREDSRPRQKQCWLVLVQYIAAGPSPVSV